jgi:RNA-directed DNA polymerase
LEDKIVQRATVAVLNAIYEKDFLGFSYGFRPKRGQHDALDALAVGIGNKRVNFILDADVASFFDSVSNEKLVRFVEHRVGDPRIIRLIQKWLKAGVLEDGVVTDSETGTGQGSVISPLLANVYLHYTFDLRAERWRRREAMGDMIIVRCADDLIVGFEHEADAWRFWDAMRTRLQEFSLSLNPEKTRLIEFGRYAADRRARSGSENRRPSTSWDSPTSAANPDGAHSSSNGEPDGIACGQGSGRLKRNCDGGCISPFPSRDDGWRRS